MAQDIQGRTSASSISEGLTEQEMQELNADTFQSEIEEDSEAESEEVEMNPEDIVGEVLEHIEAGEGHEHSHEHPRLRRALLTRFIVRHMVRATLIYTKAVVRRMLRNAALRRRLIAASRRGPRALRAFLAPAILRAIPRPFRRPTRRLLPLVILLSFRLIAKQAGLHSHEADAAECEAE